MEGVFDMLKQASLNKEGIAKDYEQLHADASKVLLLTEELLERERSLEERVRAVESKEDELHSFRQRIEECEAEICRKMRELASSEEEKLAMKRRCFSMAQNQLDKDKELGMRELQLSELERVIALKHQELRSVMDKIKDCSRELRVKEEQLDRVKKSVGRFNEALDLKEQLDAITQSFDDKMSATLDLKERDLGVIETTIGNAHGSCQLFLGSASSDAQPVPASTTASSSGSGVHQQSSQQHPHKRRYAEH